MKLQKNIKNNNNEEKLRIIKEQAERLNQYIQTSKLAKLLGVSRKTISRNCKNGKYIYRKVKDIGGTHYEILLSSLEPKYINILKDKNETCHCEAHEVSCVNPNINPDLKGILSQFKFNDEEIILVERFFNGGNFLKNAVFDVIKKDIV